MKFVAQYIKNSATKTKKKYTFTKITYDKFERLSMDTDDYDETEIDGHRVEVHRNKKGFVDALYYSSKKIGSMCKDFDSKDEVSFSEHDTNWPWN